MADDLNLNNAEDVIGIFERAAESLRKSPLRKGCTMRLPASGRLLATGDLHDNPDHLRKIIALAALEQSPDHHVVLHEMIHGDRMINGMDFSYRTLARIAKLVADFPGQVHPMLANHELSQLTGKGVSKGAGNSVELFNDALEYVFHDDWTSVSEAMCDFLRAMPLAVISDSGVLCAHSLPDEVAMRWFDPKILERELEDADIAGPTGSAYSMLWGRRYAEAQVEELTQKWNVKLFILGHKHVETGIEMIGSRVIVLNSDHERGTVLPIDLANVPGAEEAFAQAIPLSSV